MGHNSEAHAPDRDTARSRAPTVCKRPCVLSSPPRPCTEPPLEQFQTKKAPFMHHKFARRRPGPGLLPSRLAAAALGAPLFLAHMQPAAADLALPDVTVGAGLQTNYYHCENACIYSSGTPNSPGGSVDGFDLDSIRLYVNGAVTSQIKFTFDTEYTGSGSGPGANKVGVLDAIAQYDLSPAFNLWAGRFLPPSDRANLYGPYYADDWAPYADGVADFYPDVATGRDNGLAYWGDYGPLKLQVGAFDGGSLNSAVADKSRLLGAARAMWDFWDKESGYYLNGTYYGDKHVLALGIAGQTQDSKTAWSLDGLLDEPLGGIGAISLEAEYQKDDGLVATAASHGWYALAGYLFPQVIGIGKFQPLVKYSVKTFDASTAAVTENFVPGFELKTTEVDLNYVIKEFNARVGLYYLHQSSHDITVVGGAPSEAGVKLQLQM